jgi:3-phenylpropionate/trans-cinnamate dioxygenase ferredoxin subunit
MKEKKLKWHKLAGSVQEIEWGKNNMAVVEVAGKKMTLINFDNELFACAHKCPHAGGILSEGFIDGAGYVVCPIHRYRFDPSNGRNVTGEGYYLKTFSVEVREAGVFIGFEETTWLGIFK